jgi:hypothetical protein
MTAKLALVLVGIVLLTGCAKEDKYEVLSATRETRKTATGDSDFIVFKLKHDQTIITARCQRWTNEVEMKCAELAVGDRYALRRIRHGSTDALLFRNPEQESGDAYKQSGGAVLIVEAESIQ